METAKSKTTGPYCMICGGPAPCARHTFTQAEGEIGKWGNTQTTEPSREERLEAALSMALAVISDYLAYEHNGDPWEEDARAMGEMEINDYGRDGRMQQALELIGVKP